MDHQKESMTIIKKLKIYYPRGRFNASASLIIAFAGNKENVRPFGKTTRDFLENFYRLSEITFCTSIYNISQIAEKCPWAHTNFIPLIIFFHAHF